ncbi:MAG: glutamate racemase [Rhodobacteraceae bacterium]|nr:glutamate racemase [Paracoccaceae bacterium]
MPIGIFDSGLGGLTIYDAIDRRLPHTELIYWGDNKRAPYGTKTSEEIYQFTSRSICELWQRGCQLVVLACNTASAVTLKRLQEEFVPPNRRVLGVFVPTIESITERTWGDNSPPKEVSVQRLALFATPATVASRAFQRELSFRAIGVDVESQACAGLVDAIEDGDLKLAATLAKRHVKSLLGRMSTPDVAVLGCTHYPIVFKAFQEALGPEVRVISQPALVADSLIDYLNRHDWIHLGNKNNSFFTTADPVAVSSKAKLFLQKPLEFQTADWM